MKPAPFSYHRTRSVPETVALLAELGDGAKILAGGQSLVPMMNFRLARPSALVDVTRIPGLEYLRAGPDGLRVGALTRHRTIEFCRDPGVLDGFAVLPRSARWIGHYPIRARGTLGGSIAHADPAAEWCLLAVLLGREVVLEGPRGAHHAGHRVLRGLLLHRGAARRDDHRDPLPAPARHAALTEFAQRKGDFAVVAAAVPLELDDGTCHAMRVVLGGVGPLPFLVDTAELAGQPATPDTWRAAGELAAAQIDPPADGHGSRLPQEAGRHPGRARAPEAARAKPTRTPAWVGAAACHRAPRTGDAARPRPVHRGHQRGALHAAFVRSPFAAAGIGAIDTSAALALPGVGAVFTAADLGHPDLLAVLERPEFTPTVLPLLATDQVRHVAEPVAMVIADDPYPAEDAAELVDVEWTPLPPVTGLAAARSPGARPVHDGLTGNCQVELTMFDDARLEGSSPAPRR